MPDLREKHHPGCVVCSPHCAHGLQLQFSPDGEGEVICAFACDPRYEGYPGLLHGGVISALLDGAMTNCLFTHGCAAVTAEMVVRFRHPVLLGRPAEIRAWIAGDHPTLFRLQATLVQDGVVKATARATFMMPKFLSSAIGVAPA